MKKKSKFKLLQDKISEHSDDINISGILTNENVNIGTNIDVTILKSDIKIINKDFQLNQDRLSNEPIKTTKYTLFPNEKQKKILQNWFQAYIHMYNSIIFIIKTKFRDFLKKNKLAKITDLNIDLDMSKLKKKSKNIKNRLRKNYKINMHILDYAINDAIAMYKSKISNLKNGHIKKSKLRYLKKTKKTKIIKIENMLCTDNSFCTAQLGKEMNVSPSLNFKQNIQMAAIIQYDKKKDGYYLFVRERIISEQLKNDSIEKIEKNKTIMQTSNEYLKFMKKNDLTTNVECIKELNKLLNKHNRRINGKLLCDNNRHYKNMKTGNKNDLAIDVGIITFITGLSNDHLLEIGKKISIKIRKTLIYLDKIENDQHLNDKTKQKIIIRTKDKLKNRITDYHWKIINYLTSNYRQIIIGNFSTKQMGESNINKMIKRIGKAICLYKFKQRLQYKCYMNGIKYKDSDEYCTSKCCSSCGNFKKDLGSNRIYECNKCGLKTGRDINAAKNIYMKEIK